MGEERAGASEQRMRGVEEKDDGYKVYDSREDKTGTDDVLFVH